jgi:hypothetical protein
VNVELQGKEKALKKQPGLKTLHPWQKH